VRDIPPERRSTNELYEQFRDAGERKARLDRKVRRRARLQQIPGPVLGAVLAFLLVGGGVAIGPEVFTSDTGATLTGRGGSGEVRQAPADRRLARAAVTDPRVAGARWGLLIYQDTQGQTCAAPGRLVGGEVGIVQGGRFSAYAQSPPGAQCGRPTQSSLLAWVRYYRIAEQKRSLLYGVADRTVTDLRIIGASTPVPIAPDGSFLVVGVGDHAFHGSTLRVTSGATTKDIKLHH
jgi:hypothetical protein